MDCRVAPAPRNDIQLTHTPRPFGESGFADAGEGLNIILTITHPNLPSYREGTRVVVRLAHIPRPLKIPSLRG